MVAVIDSHFNPEDSPFRQYTGVNVFMGAQGSEHLELVRDRLDRLSTSSSETPLQDIPDIDQPVAKQHIVVIPEKDISIPMTPSPRIFEVTPSERSMRARRILAKRAGELAANNAQPHDYEGNYARLHTPMSPVDYYELLQQLQQERTDFGNDVIRAMCTTRPAPKYSEALEPSEPSSSKLVGFFSGILRRLPTRKSRSARLGFHG